jgi:protease-4
VLVTLVVVAVAAAVGYALFVVVPDGNVAAFFGVLAAVSLAVTGARFGSTLASNAFPDYDVAEVSVDGPITRDGGGGPLPTTPGTAGADEVVEQIERADEDDAVEALLVKLNTPGGAVVPSDDIREAAREFDGPTVGYTNDLCASGGMWIASGCDELWARDASLVGSIGVRFSQTRFAEFADEHGISYERIVSGDYKDSLGAPFKHLEDREREYLQGLSDDWYEKFVERVAENTDLDAEAVRDTEARVYLGEDAAEMGLVDALGDRDAVEDALAERLGHDVSVAEFEPQRSLGERLQGGAATVAYAFGSGVAAVVGGDVDGLELR